MASGTLYAYPGQFRATKILVAGKYSGAKIDVVAEAPNFILGETNKTTDFLKKFPLGKVPAFETSDHKYIFESNAIAHYVGTDELRGKTPEDQAYILQWINFADNEILPASCAWVFPTLSIMQPKKQVIEQAKEDIKKMLTILNDHLLTRTFLVGERITQADITMASTLMHLYEHAMEPSFREHFGNVNRWFATVTNQQQFLDIVGELKWCTKSEKFNADRFAKLQKKEIEEKKPKQTPPKAVKKTEQAPATSTKNKEEEELDETEEILAAESKTKDPFEEFPKGTFVIDDFKRVYSNEDEKISVPYFWEKFDKENYSIWFCEYKYPEELTMVYMSCNLIAGMFQRLDKMRKHAFASMVLFGEDNASTISGVWIWRGQNLAFELSSDWQVDYESYLWKKLDPDVDDTKKLVTEYLSWSGDFGGKKFNQGKIFK